MDLKEIQNLIKFVSNSGVAEVKLETGDIKITIRTTLEGNSPDITYVQQAPMQQTMAAPVAAAPVAAATPAAGRRFGCCAIAAGIAGLAKPARVKSS